MSLQIIRITCILIGGTIGGYLSVKIGEYIYDNNKKKKPQIENNIENNQKIKTVEDLMKREIEIQSKPDFDMGIKTESDSDNYFKDYLEILQNEKKIQQEKEILFINDAIYDNNYYDYIFTYG